MNLKVKNVSYEITGDERLKDALFEAKLKGLKFSGDIDMTPQNRTSYEII